MKNWCFGPHVAPLCEPNPHMGISHSDSWMSPECSLTTGGKWFPLYPACDGENMASGMCPGREHCFNPFREGLPSMGSFYLSPGLSCVGGNSRGAMMQSSGPCGEAKSRDLGGRKWFLLSFKEAWRKGHRMGVVVKANVGSSDIDLIGGIRAGLLIA